MIEASTKRLAMSGLAVDLVGLRLDHGRVGGVAGVGHQEDLRLEAAFFSIAKGSEVR